MKAFKYLATALAGIFLFVCCKKELSYENGLPLTIAKGSLKDSSGNCMTVTVNGKYLKNGALTDSNYIVVQVNFTTPGSYSISTDTSNGFSFHGSGITGDSGLQSVTLKGTGTPSAVQLTNFSVAFDTSVCTFSVNVADSAIRPPVTSNDYFPTSDSSNWTYEFNTGDTIHTQVSTTDHTIAGNTYRTFLDTSPDIADTQYYRKGGGIYYQYSDIDDFSIFDSVSDKVEYPFLKDNVPVGSTWDSPEVNATLSSIAGKAKIKFTIADKDIQTTVGTKTFDSVIVVKREYMFAPSPSGTYGTVVIGNFYYAKNLGFIKAEALAPLSSALYVDRVQIYY